MMTGGRSPLFEDVILDSSGAILACTILVIYYLLAHRKKGLKTKLIDGNYDKLAL